MPAAKKEKRKHPRSRHNSVLEFHDESGRLIDAVARLVDVSKTGACFASSHPFTIGKKIRARLRLLKEGVLNITGRIVWSRKKANSTLYGISFDSVESA